MKLIEARENDKVEVEIRLSFTNKDRILLGKAGWDSKNKQTEIINLLISALQLFGLPEATPTPKQPETKGD
jgi:hypothetical protein